MSWLLIALGAVVSAVTKPKPYTPSADYIRITKALEDEQNRYYEPQRINLREILPTDYTTEEERQECIKAWKDYYKKIRPNAITLSCSMYIDGYNDVVNGFKIKDTEDWINY